MLSGWVGVRACVRACVRVCMCVVGGGTGAVCVYMLRIVSTDKMLHFITTLILNYYYYCCCLAVL